MDTYVFFCLRIRMALCLTAFLAGPSRILANCSLYLRKSISSNLIFSSMVLARPSTCIYFSIKTYKWRKTQSNWQKTSTFSKRKRCKKQGRLQLVIEGNQQQQTKLAKWKVQLHPLHLFLFLSFTSKLGISWEICRCLWNVCACVN